MVDTPRVPAQLEAIVEALGVDDAVEFLLTFGGAEVYIAANPTNNSMVAKHFGLQKAQALGKVANRLPKQMPLQKRWIAQVLYSKGLTSAAIARRLHVSIYTVRRYLNSVEKRKPPDPNQFALDL